ncbi:DUF2155 domain-containing protein [Nitrospirillum pindoramense]|uniref:DUF2155 domain-containing protein n=1 Tax=Nitrospirillum amazonense TaxID=28077 RepID=A0A560HGX3_9PROT|nr:DUF2155 domain-containing protein [Nitrospirillum amazonense]TWB45708.1 hypothetical protein FBZ90_10140 [Nitrospirillum amazonense]
MSLRRLLLAASCLAVAATAGAWAQSTPTIPAGAPPVPPASPAAAAPGASPSEVKKTVDQAPEEQPPTSQPVSGPNAAGQQQDQQPAEGAQGTAAGGGAEGASPVTPLPPLPAQPAVPRTFEDMKVAVLGGLDKVTGRVSTVEIPVGQTGRFGQLTVAARACRKTTPIEEPESAAFLDIVEAKPDDPAAKVFTGWMFASSPALSAMEDPVYDVWVVDCRNPATKAPSSKLPSGKSQ